MFWCLCNLWIFNILVQHLPLFFQIPFSTTLWGNRWGTLAATLLCLDYSRKKHKRHAETKRAKDFFCFLCLRSSKAGMLAVLVTSQAWVWIFRIDLCWFESLKFEAHEMYLLLDTVRCGIHFQGLKCAIPQVIRILICLPAFASTCLFFSLNRAL